MMTSVWIWRLTVMKSARKWEFVVFLFFTVVFMVFEVLAPAVHRSLSSDLSEREEREI